MAKDDPCDECVHVTNGSSNKSFLSFNFIAYLQKNIHKAETTSGCSSILLVVSSQSPLFGSSLSSQTLNLGGPKFQAR